MRWVLDLTLFIVKVSFSSVDYVDESWSRSSEILRIFEGIGNDPHNIKQQDPFQISRAALNILDGS